MKDKFEIPEWYKIMVAESDARLEKMRAESDARLEKMRAESDAEWEKRNAEWEKAREHSEKYWKELKEQMKASQEASDKRKAESDKELEEIKRLIKANAKQIGGIDMSNGMMAEETIFNSLKKDMFFAGIEFHDTIRNLKKYKKSVAIKGEYDILMINGTMLAIIETKYKVREKDITKLIDTKLADFKILFPEYNNHKIVLGIGGMSFEEKSEELANENGVGIIKIVGDKVEYYTNNIKQY